jgi:HTH-type transcriptional regulator/antitoxin MqsA
MNKMKEQTCPICGVGSLIKKIGNEPFEYKGQSTMMTNYVTYACNECGEAIVDNTTLKESGKKLKDFQRQVDGLLNGQQIKAIRMKLGLTQVQLADIVGGGLKSLARYESGQICQSKGMDNLLRILDAYPHTLNIIRKNDLTTIFSNKVVYIKDVIGQESYHYKNTGFSVETEESAYES